MTEPAASPLILEVTVGAPVEAVWKSLRDKDSLTQWHGWLFDGLDEEIETIYGAGARVEEPHQLTVDGGDRFELSAVDGGTLVRLVRAPRGSNPEWDEWYEDINEGWTSFLQQLRFRHEVHPESARRTLFFDADGADLPHPVETLGVLDPAPTAPYAPAGPTGGGRIWFVSAHQVGLTVDDLGPGLLVAGAKPEHQGGGVMAILSTYGLDEEEFAAVRARWAAWWRQHYPAG